MVTYIIGPSLLDHHGIADDALPLAGPEHGVLLSVCDNIPSEPQATDCTRTGGSIKVLHPETNRMAVVMFSPASEPPLDRETAQAFSIAVAGAIYECSPLGVPATLDATTAVSCLQDKLVRILSEPGRPPRVPRALALLPLSGFAGLPKTGIASPEGHVVRYPGVGASGFRVGQFITFTVIFLGPAPAPVP